MPDLLTEIIYEEFERSPVETLNIEGFTATRVLRVKWNDRQQLRRDLLRTTFPGAAENVVCVSITSEPFEAANLGVEHIAAFEFARMTLNYESQVLLDVESIEPTAEFLTTGVKDLKWGSPSGDAVQTDEAPGTLFVGFDYIIERKGIKEFPINVLALIGKVNDVQISPTADQLNKLVFDKETLLYNPPTITPSFDAAGKRIWDVVFRFTYKPNFDGSIARGWNFFWRPDEGNGKYQKMFRSSGPEYKPYPTGDFTTI